MASNPANWLSAYTHATVVEEMTVAHNGSLDSRQLATAAYLARQQRLQACRVDGRLVSTARGAHLGDTVLDSPINRAVLAVRDGCRAHCPGCRVYLRRKAKGQIAHPGPECEEWCKATEWLCRHLDGYARIYGHKPNPTLVPIHE